MSAVELAWRVDQKRLAVKERRDFARQIPVYDVRKYGLPQTVDLSRLGLNYLYETCLDNAEIELLGDFSYLEYRKRWHASFNGPEDWPVRFSADYNFGEESVPGDIRTNWELNRHYQFAVLAKSYFVTRDACYLSELTELFADWNQSNPFMWGPEWASPMEEAIRLINWLVAAAFLEASGEPFVDHLHEQICAGAWVMSAHIREHYSRHSSANNHTIVEAAGVAIAAIVFGQRSWLDEALEILESEVELQTYVDGVNKEQALHYQLLVMEALCLVSHALQAAGKQLPESLIRQLCSMAHYASACRVDNGGCIEFGDNDEGIILNLATAKPNYLEYVLAFATLECGSGLRWVDCDSCCETLNWMYTNAQLKAADANPLLNDAPVESFPDGGVTIVRFDEGRSVFAFDHGPLGFGELAAHAHADALSVQLYVDGFPVLIDPGTYIYNGDRASRDRYRSTSMHNTVCVGEVDQSEMLGPFIWGRKAGVFGFELDTAADGVHMAAGHDGYGFTVLRSIDIDGSEIVIRDTVLGDCAKAAVSHLHLPGPVSSLNDMAVEMVYTSSFKVRIVASAPLACQAFEYSPEYRVVEKGTEILIPFESELVTTISIARE